LKNHVQERQKNKDMTTRLLILEFLAVLACLLVPIGCEDKDKKKALAEAAEAKILLAKVKADLSKAKNKIADLEEELEAIKEIHDELQKQVEQRAGERDTAIAVAEQTLAKIKDLTAQSDGQVESVGILLHNEIEQLKAVIESQRTTIAEQQAAIEEMQKIIEQQQETTEEQQENAEKQEQTTEAVEEQ